MNTLLCTQVFRDRRHAGELLASRLQAIAATDPVVVLGLPRGGVPVAATVARKLGCPLDVIVVHKLCVPGDEEIAFGALASGGVEIHNEDVISSFGLPPHTIGRIANRARIELAHREHLVRWARPLLALRDAVAVIVDDGVATGATMRAAVRAARWRGATRVIAAAPVAPHESAERIRQDTEDVVSVVEPDHLLSVSEFYADFSPTTDDEVLEILRAQPFGVGHVEEEPL